MIDVNFKGCLRLTKAVLPGMVERGWGRIVNIGSDAGRVGSSLESVYSGAKGAVIAFTKTIAREVARDGVTANTVCPGPTETPMLRRSRPGRRGEKVIEAMQARGADEAARHARGRRRRGRVPRFRGGGVHHGPDAVGERRADHESEIDRRSEVDELTDVQYEVEDGLAWITINRPERMNAFRARTVDELIHCFKRAWADGEVGVVCLTGRRRPRLLHRRRPEAARRDRRLRAVRVGPVRGRVSSTG